VIVAMIAAITSEFCLARSNKKKEQISEAEIRSQFTQAELDEQGDKSKLYKYTL